MAAKPLGSLSALALLVQSVLSQCLPFDGCECNPFFPAASTGGSFVVTSSSPVAPVGISVVSDNLYEGILFIEGNLPLLGSVAVEGTMGTAGAGAVSYGCGDGAVGIATEEGPIITGIAPEASGYLGFGNGLYGFGYGNLYGLGYGNLFGFGYGNLRGYGYNNGLGSSFYRLGYGNSCKGLCGCGSGLGLIY